MLCAKWYFSPNEELSFFVEPNKVPNRFSNTATIIFSMSIDWHMGEDDTKRSIDLNRWYKKLYQCSSSWNDSQWLLIHWSLIDFPGEAATELQSIYRPALTLNIDQKPPIIHWVVFSKFVSVQKNKQTLCVQIQKASK